MMPQGRMLRFAAAPLLLALTGGCVAAAIPVLAGSVLAKKRLDKPGQPVAPPTGSPIVTLPAEMAPERPHLPAPDAELAATTPVGNSAESAPGMPVPVVKPDPVTATASGLGGTGFAAFAAYAEAQSKIIPAQGAARLSVLIDPATLLDGPKPLACGSQPLAVAIDLDPGTATFDLNDPPAPAAGLAETLTQVRAAGITVFWTSALPVEQGSKLYSVLRATGLDMDGTDRVLLPRKADETKQARRLAAARDWCFIALAGDRASDFEEAIDYLRDPDGPIARAMDPLRGAGWFITPDPID